MSAFIVHAPFYPRLLAAMAVLQTFGCRNAAPPDHAPIPRPVLRWTLVFVLACPTIVSAQMVRGTVTDATTGAPVTAADLSLYTSEGRRILRGVSDDDGKFEMLLPKGKTVYLQPFLDRASLYKRAGIGHIWTRGELERRNPALVSHILDRWAPPRPAVNCEGLLVFIDDWPVDAEDIDLLVGPDQLEGVELYNDITIPPDLLMKAMSVRKANAWPPCKTVLLWRHMAHRALGQWHAVRRWHSQAGRAAPTHDRRSGRALLFRDATRTSG